MRALVVEGGAVVPARWRLEIANTLLMAERRTRMSGADRQVAIAALQRLAIDVDDETDARAFGEIATLAARFRLTASDAAYLELAQRTGLPLATLDDDLRAAALKLGVALPEG